MQTAVWLILLLLTQIGVVRFFRIATRGDQD